MQTISVQSELDKLSVKEIVEKLNIWLEAYEKGSPIVSDPVYDAYRDKLLVLDPENSFLKKVGFHPSSGFKKTKIPSEVRMGSLNKQSTIEDIENWLDKEAPQEKYLTPKIDGFSGLAVYKKGKLVSFLRRGDGVDADDIISNAKRFKNIPKNIIYEDDIYVRGEVVLKIPDFEKYFSDYANPRNCAAGIANRLDGIGSEHLSFIAYEIFQENEQFVNKTDQFVHLKDLSFEIPKFYICKNTKDVLQIYKKYCDGEKNNLDYLIDGLVVGVNNLEKQESMGYVSNRPKHSIALKFPDETATTKIKEINWFVGLRGLITPVATVEPITLEGTCVQNASLCNYGYIKDLELNVGCKVLVRKAGQIIPRIESAIEKTGTIAEYPKKCPECGTELEFKGEYLVCYNRSNCPAQVSGKILNWVKTINILELGDKLIDKLIESEKVQNISDLYKLTEKDLSSLDRMGDISAKNVYNSIWSIKEIDLPTFIGAIGIPGIGVSRAKLIIDAGHNDINKLFSITQEELLKIKGFGPSLINSFIYGIRQNKSLIEDILSLGIKIKSTEKKELSGSLSGKTFVFTGTLSIPRKKLESIVVSNGGKVSDRVSKDTTYLVIADPDSNSTKAKAARSNGTKPISEDEFLKIVGLN